MKHALFGLGLMACSMTVMASPAAQSTGPTRAQVMSLFRYQCPIQVGQLLSDASPDTRADTSARSADVCTCVNERMALIPERVPHAALPDLAAADMLACSRPVITERHQQWIRATYGARLQTQGWSTAQVDVLSQCITQRHWRQIVEAGLQEGRHSRLHVPDLWQPCAAEAGHPQAPMPTQIK